MFCTACGTAITPEQIICSKCGVPTSLGVMRGGSVRRVAEHLQLLGVLHIVYSGFIILGGLGLVFVGKVIFGWFIRFLPGNSPPPPWFMAPLVTFIGWVILIRGIVGIAAGVGLLQRAPWARIFALVMAFLSILSFPFGTALGIYTIWVLLASGAGEEYERLALMPH